MCSSLLSGVSQSTLLFCACLVLLLLCQEFHSISSSFISSSPFLQSLLMFFSSLKSYQHIWLSHVLSFFSISLHAFRLSAILALINLLLKGNFIPLAYLETMRSPAVISKEQFNSMIHWTR